MDVLDLRSAPPSRVDDKYGDIAARSRSRACVTFFGTSLCLPNNFALSFDVMSCLSNNTGVTP